MTKSGKKKETTTKQEETKTESFGLTKDSNTKLDEIINSKDYILRSLGSQYFRLECSCDMKWEQALKAEEDGSTDLSINRRSKKENTDLREYNQQVKALADVGIKLVAIQKSDFKTVEEERQFEKGEDEEELV